MHRCRFCVRAGCGVRRRTIRGVASLTKEDIHTDLICRENHALNVTRPHLNAIDSHAHQLDRISVCGIRIRGSRIYQSQVRIIPACLAPERNEWSSRAGVDEYEFLVCSYQRR